MRSATAATTARATAPGALNVHAWAPYWALDDALAGARGPRRHAPPAVAVLVPAPPASTRSRSSRTRRPTRPSEFLDPARERDVPLVRVDPRRHRRRRDGRRSSPTPTQRARHVDAIAAFAADGDFDGIDIDYEQFAFADGRDSWAATRPNWVAFVGELAERLHADGRTLAVSIPPVYDAGQTDDSGYWVYDYAAIAPLVDSIRVMAYDYSVPSRDPGADRPARLGRPGHRRHERGVRATRPSSCSASRCTATTGRSATTGTCPATAEGVTTVTDRTVDDLAAGAAATPVFDAATCEWSFTYELVVDDGTTSCTQQREVHYVDADGAQKRMQRAVDAGFGGVALFALGYERRRRCGAPSTRSPPSCSAARRPRRPTHDRAPRPSDVSERRDEGAPGRRDLRAVPAELRAGGHASPTPGRTPRRPAC